MPRSRAKALRRESQNPRALAPLIMDRNQVDPKVRLVLHKLADCPMFQKFMPPLPERQTMIEEVYIRVCRRMVLMSDDDARYAGILVDGMEDFTYSTAMRNRAYRYVKRVVGMMQPIWSSVAQEVINMICTLDCCCACNVTGTSKECKQAIDNMDSGSDALSASQQAASHSAMSPEKASREAAIRDAARCEAKSQDFLETLDLAFEDLFNFDLIFEHEDLDD